MVGGSPERIYVLYPNVSKSVVTLHDVDIRYQVMICFHFVLDTRFNQFGLKKRHKYLIINRRYFWTRVSLWTSCTFLMCKSILPIDSSISLHKDRLFGRLMKQLEQTLFIIKLPIRLNNSFNLIESQLGTKIPFEHELIWRLLQKKRIKWEVPQMSFYQEL